MASLKVLVSLSVTDIVLLIGFVYSILYLRRTHAGHVFNIWYACWTIFVLFFGLFYYVLAHAQTIARSPLSGGAFLGKVMIWFEATSMDFRDEAYLIASIYTIVLLPQILSYISSGIFGCAKRVVFLEWITATVTWIVIKFLAVLSGILMAQAAVSFYANPIISPLDFPLKILEAIMMISVSFIIAGILYFTYSFTFKRWLWEVRAWLRQRKRFMRIATYITSYTDSAEAKEARKNRYAWLRARLRKMTAALVVEVAENYREYTPRGRGEPGAPSRDRVV